MTDPLASITRSPQPAGPPVGLDQRHPLEVSELRQLWSMLDGGAIMVVEVRHRLWRSWGLCPRHGWGFLAMEVELRGGHPLTSTVLLEDLVGRAVRAVRRAFGRPLSGPRRLLGTRASCLTCDFVDLVRRGGEGNPLARPTREWLDRMRPLPALAATSALLAATEREWRPRACPGCLAGGGPLCRPHLLAGSVSLDDRRRTLAALEDLSGRLTRYGRSMTWRGPAARPEDRAALVEGLAWTGGWRAPLGLLAGREAAAGPERHV